MGKKIVESKCNARKVWDIINKELFPTAKDSNRISEVTVHTLVSHFSSIGTKIYGELASKFDLPSIHRRRISYNEAYLFLEPTDYEEIIACVSSQQERMTYMPKTLN